MSDESFYVWLPAQRQKSNFGSTLGVIAIAAVIGIIAGYAVRR